jgi:hypothetical protein
MDYLCRDIPVVIAVNFWPIRSSVRLDMDFGSYQVPPTDVHKHAMGCVRFLCHIVDRCEHLCFLLYPRYERFAHGPDGPALWVRAQGGNVIHNRQQTRGR